MIHFVGAGSGAKDLITVRGQRLLGEADIIIYAGSLVNPELLDEKKEGCEVFNSAKMTLEEVLTVMEEGDQKGCEIVRLHTGDPCVYGAIREQMDALDEKGIVYDYCPGVSSFCGAASALNLEYTLPDISQSVVITRMAGRNVRRIVSEAGCRRLSGEYSRGDRLQSYMGGRGEICLYCRKSGTDREGTWYHEDGVDHCR